MSKESLAVVILAAGKGTRMGGERPKVLIRSNREPLLHSVLSTAEGVGPEKIVVVTGFGKELVEESAREWGEKYGHGEKISFAFQKEQNGTGDAVREALSELNDFAGEVLILCGDAPLIRKESLLSLIEKHRGEKATVSVLTAKLTDPASYGRIVRESENGPLTAIREAKDCTAEELLINEVNSGVYVVDSAFLPGALGQLSDDNAQGELYLTDIVARATTEGQGVIGVVAESGSEILGVNTYSDLSEVNRTMNKETLESLLSSGVLIPNPESVSIHGDAKIASGTTIGPGTCIGEGVTIGKNVTIEGMCFIINSSIGDDVNLRWGLRIEDSTVGDNSIVGPFAHLRGGTELKEGVKIGNFVETKNTTMSAGAKASHLTYLGDSSVGKDANIGAGTITCNYDGVKKSKTTIEDGAFVGSNTSLVAPVTVGKNATIGAGSTITKDVPEDTLALTRAPQKEIGDWSKRKK